MPIFHDSLILTQAYDQSLFKFTYTSTPYFYSDYRNHILTFKLHIQTPYCDL